MTISHICFCVEKGKTPLITFSWNSPSPFLPHSQCHYEKWKKKKTLKFCTTEKLNKEQYSTSGRIYRAERPNTPLDRNCSGVFSSREIRTLWWLTLHNSKFLLSIWGSIYVKYATKPAAVRPFGTCHVLTGSAEKRMKS